MIRVIVATILAAAASVLLQGCTPSARQLATCIGGRAAVRCAPQCISCVRGVVDECRKEQPAASSPVCQ